MADRKTETYTRGEFLRQCAVGMGAAAVLGSFGGRARGQAATPVAGSGKVYDMREFIHWINTELEPSVKLPGGAGHYVRKPGDKELELYGVSDMACIFYTLGQLRPNEKERAEWAEAFQGFQNPETGWLVEKTPSHAPLHNTAFALAAMELMDLRPKFPVRMGPEYSDPKAFLATLNWKTAVYTESHKGAGMGSIFALVPELGTPQWFAEYFAACEALFDPRNGLMGQEKPAGGDFDQVGGTFHYNFLYSYFNRQMPYPERRIDAVIGLQQPDGHWDKTNHTWLTMDAMYILTRTLRYCPYRTEDVKRVVRRIMDVCMEDLFSPEGRKTAFAGNLPVHTATCAISMAAEAQNFLGAKEVVTERPLHLVLDRRPFI